MKTGREERYVNDEKHCTQGCGRSMRLNPITLSREEIEFLVILQRDFGGSVSRLKQMKLAGHVYVRAGAPKYWGLTEGPKGTHTITDFGYRFLAGEVRIPKTVFMFDSRIVDREGPLVSVQDVLREDYKTYEQVLDEIRTLQRPVPEAVRATNVRRRLVRKPGPLSSP